MNRPYRLLPVPEAMLRIPARALGRSEDVERLLGSLEVDSAHIRDVLGWSPRVTLDDGLARMCAWYMSEVARHG
ncbi:MAG: NAD-dependent dehydratase, partial [FCB group bacterium]|jgi:UDP-glucose 4-epimerase|nr:NAD-dependent dehydratase [FCB group bacterium]